MTTGRINQVTILSLSTSTPGRPPERSEHYQVRDAEALQAITLEALKVLVA